MAYGTDASEVEIKLTVSLTGGADTVVLVVIVDDPIVVAVLNIGDTVEIVETVTEVVATLASNLPIRDPPSSLNHIFPFVAARMSHGEFPAGREYSTKMFDPAMNFPILLVACSVNQTLL